MLLIAMGFLVLAAILGLVLITKFFMKKPMSVEVAIFHGMSAEAGFILVFVKAYYMNFSGLFILDLILLASAALAGLSLVMIFHLRGKKLPVGLVLVHATIGVTGFFMLAIKTLSGA
jgi:hypothetical protein